MKNKMLRVINHFYRNKWIKLLVIPVILICFWVICSLLFSSYANFTILTHNYERSAIISSPQSLLLNGKSIVGEFSAAENNLGIISIRFLTHEKLSYEDQDNVVFRIKERDAKTWFYQRTYTAGGIYELPLYPFGFPKITDSKGKIYIFSITSLKGNKENALQLSGSEPILVTKYVYTKSELLANKKNLLQYLVKKFITSFTDLAFFESSLIYLLPFIFYILWISIFERLRIDRYNFLFIFPLLIFLGITINIDLTFSFFLAIVIFWIITIRVYQLESSISFLFSTIFFFFAFVWIFFGFQEIGGRISNWTYIFLGIGVIQLLEELKNPNENRLTYSILLNSLFPKKFLHIVKKYIKK
jgi:hypothetical protein